MSSDDAKPRWQVERRPGSCEGVVASDWEIHETGALIFSNRDEHWVDHVVTYAPGAWLSFFPER